MQKTFPGINEKLWTKNFLTLTLTNGLFFGDGDSGIYESADDQINFQIGGDVDFFISRQQELLTTSSLDHLKN